MSHTQVESSVESDRRVIHEGFVSRVYWTVDGEPFLYFVDGSRVNLISLLGETIAFEVSEESRCVDCGDIAKSSPCADCQGKAKYSKCVYRPGVRCTYSNCPYPDFKQRSCSKNFLVYLVAKDRVKVGITQRSRLLNRWYEQGADAGVVIARAPNRKVAGIIERECTDFVSDRSASGLYEPINNPRQSLFRKAEELRSKLPASVEEYMIKESDVVDSFVCVEYPEVEGDVDKTSVKEVSMGQIHVRCVKGSLVIGEDKYFNLGGVNSQKIEVSLFYNDGND